MDFCGRKLISELAIALVLSLCSQVVGMAASELEHADNLIEAGKYDDAIAYIRKVEKQARKNGSDLQSRVALSYLYKGDNKSALAQANLVLRKDPKNQQAHWVLANIYMSTGQIEKGASEHELAIKYGSKKPCKPCKKSFEAVFAKQSISR